MDIYNNAFDRGASSSGNDIQSKKTKLSIIYEREETRFFTDFAGSP